MNRFTLSISAAVFALSAPSAVLAEHHEGGSEAHKCEKTEDGTMKCCMTDKDGKKVCHMMEGEKMDHSTMDHSTMDPSKMDPSKMDQGKMDHSTMDHGNMDHGNMDHGNMAQPETPDAEPN